MIWAASTDDSAGTGIRTLVSAAGRPNIRAELSLWGGGAPKEPVLQCVRLETPRLLVKANSSGRFGANAVRVAPTAYNLQQTPRVKSVATPDSSMAVAMMSTESTVVQREMYQNVNGEERPRMKLSLIVGLSRLIFCRFCNGKCHNGEVEVSSSTSGTGHSCWTGHKKFCCTTNAATKNQEQCSKFTSESVQREPMLTKCP